MGSSDVNESEKTGISTPDVTEVENETTIKSEEQDDAIALVGDIQRVIDPVEEARVVRKIDWCLIPAMVLGYGLVYYDKAILGSAAIFGMTTDLSLEKVDRTTLPPTTDTSRLSWATSMFYFGMLSGLYPMSFALQRFKMGRILGGVVCLWSVICMLTAATTSWRALYAQRFFLGFVESVIPTGFVCIITSFYTQREQSMRQSWWLASNPLFLIIGDTLNYGFAHIKSGKLKSWQYIYILAGMLTFIFGIICFAMPDSPVSAWFLTREERIIATERLRKGQTGVRCQKFKWAQVRESLLDLKTWLISTVIFCYIILNGAVTGFGPLIVKAFGYSTFNSILLQFPLGGIAITAVLTTGYISTRIPNARLFMLMFCGLPVIAGCLMIWKGQWYHHAAVPIVGFSIFGFFSGIGSLSASVAMANVAGQTKKCFMSATIFFAYCLGNIVGPQLIRYETEAEHYPGLWTGIITCYVILIITAGILRILLARENKRRGAMDLSDIERDKMAFLDLTDKENKYFRYVL